MLPADPYSSFAKFVSSFPPGFFSDVTEHSQKKIDRATWWPKVGTREQYKRAWANYDDDVNKNVNKQKD